MVSPSNHGRESFDKLAYVCPLFRGGLGLGRARLIPWQTAALQETS